MRTEELDYPLAPERIAQLPAEPRHSARLLVDRGPCSSPAHCTVNDLPRQLRPGDVLVVNDTRVMAARLRLRKPTGGAVEVLLLEPAPGAGDLTWEALVRPARRVRPGTQLLCDDRPALIVGERLDERGRHRVELAEHPDELMRHAGEVPLPPYIHEPLADPERYQTVYGRRAVSAAAPTAGLHFTLDLLERCRAAGVSVQRVELAVGTATFTPITAETLDGHAIHAERYRVPAETAEACAAADRVVAVGTTVVRALESAAAGRLSGDTSLFIRPGYDFACVDALLTNFHMPRSSLLALLAAFVGPRWRELYTHALQDGYRFGSFGDAMFCQRP